MVNNIASKISDPSISLHQEKLKQLDLHSPNLPNKPISIEVGAMTSAMHDSCFVTLVINIMAFETKETKRKKAFSFDINNLFVIEDVCIRKCALLLKCPVASSTKISVSNSGKKLSKNSSEATTVPFSS